MPPSRWTEWVKSWASKNNLSYGCALSNPECSAEYKKKYGTSKKVPQKKERETMGMEDVNIGKNEVFVNPKKNVESENAYTNAYSELGYALQNKQNKYLMPAIFKTGNKKGQLRNLSDRFPNESLGLEDIRRNEIKRLAKKYNIEDNWITILDNKIGDKKEIYFYNGRMKSAKDANKL